MDRLELDIDFLINSPEVKTAVSQVKADIAGLGQTTEQTIRKTAAGVSQMAGAPIGIIERLKSKLDELKEKQLQATNTASIEKYNVQIQEFQKEINRLGRIGKQGFDDMGRAIPNFERPTGQLGRMQEAARLYKQAIIEATSPEMLAKYNAKLEQTEATLKRMKNAGKSGFDAVGNAQRPTTRLGKLEYAASAYKDMIAGSDNIDIISKYNKKLQQTQAEIGRVKNIGKDGFDAFGNAVKNSGGAVNKIWSGLKTVANILPGVGIAGLLAFAIEPLMDYLSTLDLFGDKKKEIAAQAFDNTDYKAAQKNVADLTVNIEGAKKGYISKNAVVQQYNETIGKTAGQLKTFNEVENWQKEHVDEYVELMRIKAEAQAFYAASVEKSTVAAKKQVEGASFEDYTKSTLKNLSGLFQGAANGGLADFYNNVVRDANVSSAITIAENEKQAKTLSDLYSKTTLKAQEFAKANKLAYNESKTSVAKTGLKEYQSLQQKIEDLKNEYARKSQSKDDAEVKAIRDKFVKIAKEVEIFNKNPKNKIKVDGSALAGIRDAAIADLQYKQETAKQAIEFERQKKLFADYEEYKTTFGEAKAKERFGNEVKTNAQLLKELQKQANALAAKATLGALNGTGGLTGGEGERLAQLGKQAAELKAIEEKRYADAYQAAMTSAQKIEAINQNYREKAKALGASITDDQKKELLRKRDEEVNAEKETALKKIEIYQDLNRELLTLTREQIKEQLKAIGSLLDDPTLSEKIKEDLSKLQNNLKGQLNLSQNQRSLDTLTAQKSDVKKKIDAREALKITSPENDAELKKLYADLLRIENLIVKIEKRGFGKFLDKLKDNKGLAGVATGLSLASDAAMTLSEGLGGVDTEAGYTLDTIGQLAGAAGDLAGAIVSGDPAKIIGSAIKAVGTLFSIGKKVKEMNAKARQEVADFYANAIAGERAYQELLKERALQTVRDNKTTLKGIGDELKLRQSQIAEWKKESDEILQKLQGMSYITAESYKHGTWFRKAQVIKSYAGLGGMGFEQLSQLLAQGKLEGETKALVERLKELEQKGYDAEKAMADLANEVNQLFTGTTADGLTESLLDMFKQGKTGAKDMADFFESTMQDAALSVFKNNILADAMQTFYKDFAAASKDGLTDDKIANLKTLFNSLMSNATKEFDNLKAVTGIDLGKNTDKNKGTLTEAVKGITQDQASLLAGQFGGQRIATLEGNEIARQNYQTSMEQLAQAKQNGLMLVKIEDNTRRNADTADLYLPYLKEIATKMNNGSNALRAAGG